MRLATLYRKIDRFYYDKKLINFYFKVTWDFVISGFEDVNRNKIKLSYITTSEILFKIICCYTRVFSSNRKQKLTLNSSKKKKKIFFIFIFRFFVYFCISFSWEELLRMEPSASGFVDNNSNSRHVQFTRRCNSCFSRNKKTWFY